MKKIVIVTYGQPSSNPRMVKEALYISSIGFQVTVIYCPISAWGYDFDDEFIKKHNNVNWIKVGVTINNPFYFLYRLRRKIWEFIFINFGNIFDAAIKSHALFVNELVKAAIKIKADIYIGHNLPSILAVISAKKSHNGIACFDFEDFHRGEEDIDSFHWRKVKAIENAYIPFLNKTITSSPLISKEYQKNYPQFKFSTILNVFPIIHINNSENSNSKLKLLWFSQFIGPNRGIETIIEAMAKLNTRNIELTLLGSISDKYRNNILLKAKNLGIYTNQIVFLNPIPSDDLIQFASEFDIGLCSEESMAFNRDLCLTNKLFTYLNAGLAILLSNTKAQQLFLNENPGIGFCYFKRDPCSLLNLIGLYMNDPILLKSHKQTSRHYATSKYNWEIESMKLKSYYSL